MARLSSLLFAAALVLVGPAAAVAAPVLAVQFGPGLSYVSSQGCVQSGCGSGSFMVTHDAVGTCNFNFVLQQPPNGAATWHVSTSTDCHYSFAGANTVWLLARTPTPTPYHPTPTPYHPTPTPYQPTPAPTPFNIFGSGTTWATAPPGLTASVESPLTYVSGPCSAVGNATTGLRASAPQYACSSSGTIVVRLDKKTTCEIAISQAPSGWHAVVLSGPCSVALKGGTQVDIRPH